jgi:aryl-alcohol dehydrogenase-like predicted oxidoreductase
MEIVKLGRSELMVSPICFGTWQLGGDWGDFDEGRAIEAMQSAHRLGINFFDTAQGYGWGKSERLLGKALEDVLGSERESVVIATKGGLRMDGDTLVRDASPEWLRSGVESSLEALGVDYIDLYQVHWPDPDVPFAETAEALGAMVDEGKIRHIGVSNYTAKQIDEFSRTRPVETIQPVYHLFRREAEAELLPYCREHDIGVLVYGPMAHGLLTGTMSADQEFPPGDWRASSSVFQGEDFRHNLEAVEALRQFAEQRDWKVGQLAIAWVLANPAVHVAIVGARSEGHIAEAVGAAEIELGPDDLAEIERIMEPAVPVGGPSPEAMP